MDEKRIRKRVSYRLFNELAEFFKGKPSMEQCLRKVHSIIDGYRGFKSETNSGYAEESINLLLRDLGVKVKTDLNPDDYIDEYIAYVRSFIDDPNADLTTLESFNEWLEEEKYEQNIRCRKCGSLNTEQRQKTKHCTDCNHEDKIASDNQANWKISLTKEEAEKIKANPLGKRSQEDEIKLAAYEKRMPCCVYCEEPLKQIKETQEIDLIWNWNEKKKQFVKGEGDGVSNQPYCSNCETKDWKFTNNELVAY